MFWVLYYLSVGCSSVSDPHVQFHVSLAVPFQLLLEVHSLMTMSQCPQRNRDRCSHLLFDESLSCLAMGFTQARSLLYIFFLFQLPPTIRLVARILTYDNIRATCPPHTLH